MKQPTVIGQVIAGIILIWTNAILLFGLNISPRKEAALETIINGIAVLGWLLYSTVHAHGNAKVKAAYITTTGRMPSK